MARTQDSRQCCINATGTPARSKPAFVGAYAAGLVKFRGDHLAAARFGNAAVVLSVTKFGAAPSMPHARQIAAFLKNHV